MTVLAISAQAVSTIESNWQAFLEDVADGAVIKEAVKKHGTTYHLLRAYLATRPDAQAEFDRAWTASADACFDRVLQIVNRLEEQEGFESTKDVKAARTQIQALYWLASKRNPRVYGDHKTLDINMAFADMTSVLAEAQKRRDAARLDLLQQRGMVHEAQAVLDEALPAAPDLQGLL